VRNVIKYRITAEVLRERSGLTRGLPIVDFASVSTIFLLHWWSCSDHVVFINSPNPSNHGTSNLANNDIKVESQNIFYENLLPKSSLKSAVVMLNRVFWTQLLSKKF